MLVRVVFETPSGCDTDITTLTMSSWAWISLDRLDTTQGCTNWLNGSEEDSPNDHAEEQHRLEHRGGHTNHCRE